MSTSGRLHFSNWFRQGMASALASRGGSITNAPANADFPVFLDLSIDDDGQSRSARARIDLQVLGPGEVKGLDHAQVSRVEPRHGTTNFEPNYLAATEFFQPDLPWLMTPLGSREAQSLSHIRSFLMRLRMNVMQRLMQLVIQSRVCLKMNTIFGRCF